MPTSRRYLASLFCTALLVLTSCDSNEQQPADTGEDTTPAAGCDDGTAIALRVPPRATYLRVAPSDAAPPARAYRLDELGGEVVPGARIRVERLGEFQWRDVHPDSVGFGILAVFSTDDALRDRTERDRVPGAIEAGPDFVSPPSFRDNNPTDIPEDFAVFESDTLVVPEGAEYLFVSPVDRTFEDNLDEDADFRLCIVPLS